MIKTTPLQNALLAALLGSVALVGCKKKEETADNNAAPAATTPAEAPAPMTGAPPPMAASAVAVSAVTVGKSAAADKSVTTAALFAPMALGAGQSPRCEDVVSIGTATFIRTFGKDDPLYRNAKGSRFVLFQRVKVVQPLNEQQICDLLYDRQRIGNAAGPKSIPDLVDLVSNFTC